jgi:hypothetical protein
MERKIFKIDELEDLDIYYSTENIGLELLEQTLCRKCQPLPKPITSQQKIIHTHRASVLGDIMYIREQLSIHPNIIRTYNKEYIDGTKTAFPNWKRIKEIYFNLRVLDLSMYDIATILVLMKQFGYSNERIEKIVESEDMYMYPETLIYDIWCRF